MRLVIWDAIAPIITPLQSTLGHWFIGSTMDSYNWLMTTLPQVCFLPQNIFIFIRPSLDGTHYGMALSVRPSVRPFVRPSVRLLARKNVDGISGFFSNLVCGCAKVSHRLIYGLFEATSLNIYIIPWLVISAFLAFIGSFLSQRLQILHILRTFQVVKHKFHF